MSDSSDGTPADSPRSFHHRTRSEERRLEALSIGSSLPPDLKPALALAAPLKRRKALMDLALEHMRNGHPLYEFSTLPGAPSLADLTRWFTADDAAKDAYREAEECCANVLHGQILEISSTVTDPARAKVMIDARMKMIEKLHPKKFAKAEAAASAAPALVITVKQYTDVPPHVPLEEMLK